VPQNEAEAREIIRKVGELTILPDETPTVATVADKKSLQKQAFFERAENGDKVLIFETAKKAILYRPSTNKIIEIGPVVFPSSTPSATLVPTVIPTRTPVLPTFTPAPTN
jgi:hypothetical protein